MIRTLRTYGLVSGSLLLTANATWRIAARLRLIAEWLWKKHDQYFWDRVK